MVVRLAMRSAVMKVAWWAALMDQKLAGPKVSELADP
jgi:hypothetical protein